MAAPDDGKLTEPICFKASERLACDILRAATRDGCGLAEWVRNLVRQELYGRMVADFSGPEVSEEYHDERARERHR